MKNLLIVIVIFLAAGGVFAVYKTRGDRSSSPDSGKLKIVASFYPLEEFARQVTGDRADITTITPAGAEPHDYEPTPQDIIALRNADVFFYNGSGIEPWADRVIPDLKIAGVTTVNISEQFSLLESVEEEEDHEGEELGEEHATDPHVWLSPVNAQKEVQIIADTLRQTDSLYASIYQANALAYIAQLQALDQEYRLGLSDCEKKDIVTSHSAFAYLAKEYGLNQVSITGLSPDEEPSPRQLADVATFARANNIKYIFFETLVSPKLAETVAREVGAQTLVLNPIEGLDDADRAAGENYMSLMKKNLANLRTALQCQ
jgi:zinc transport system substrate-binding protein